MSQLEYDMMKKFIAEQQKTNELLQQLIDIQQPKKEVVPDKTNTRGNNRGNAVSKHRSNP